MVRLMREKKLQKKITLSENLSKLFPEPDGIFDNQKIGLMKQQYQILTKCLKN